MVQGLAFLSKKSWHTKNLVNQERVWIAEEQKKAEQAKTSELARQIQQEREQDELDNIANGGNNGTNGKSSGSSSRLDRGIDWMYHGHEKQSEIAQEDAEKQAEEYLLGKVCIPLDSTGIKVTGDLEVSANEKQGVNVAVAQAATAASVPTGRNGDSLTTTTTTPYEPTVSQRNEAFRLRMEDPMYAVTAKTVQVEKEIERRRLLYERALGVHVDVVKTNSTNANTQQSDTKSTTLNVENTSNIGNEYKDTKRTKKHKKEKKKRKKSKKSRKSSFRRGSRRSGSDQSFSECDDSSETESSDSDYSRMGRKRRNDRTTTISKQYNSDSVEHTRSDTKRRNVSDPRREGLYQNSGRSTDQDKRRRRSRSVSSTGESDKSYSHQSKPRSTNDDHEQQHQSTMSKRHSGSSNRNANSERINSYDRHENFDDRGERQHNVKFDHGRQRQDDVQPRSQHYNNGHRNAPDYQHLDPRHYHHSNNESRGRRTEGSFNDDRHSQNNNRSDYNCDSSHYYARHCDNSNNTNQSHGRFDQNPIYRRNSNSRVRDHRSADANTKIHLVDDKQTAANDIGTDPRYGLQGDKTNRDQILQTVKNNDTTLGPDAAFLQQKQYKDETEKEKRRMEWVNAREQSKQQHRMTAEERQQAIRAMQQDASNRHDYAQNRGNSNGGTGSRSKIIYSDDDNDDKPMATKGGSSIDVHNPNFLQKFTRDVTGVDKDSRALMSDRLRQRVKTNRNGGDSDRLKY